MIEHNERAQQILKALVERYIKDGQPVGSRTLATENTLPLSPASIRNILADLEKGGYLFSPHTSAGRVPTAQGYRFFIDSLLTIMPFADQHIEQLRRQLHSEQDTKALVKSASNLLSSLTHHVGLVTVPRPEKLKLCHIEFLPLGDCRMLVILVLNDKDVQNRIIHTHRPFSASELERAANYLNHHFKGQDLCSVRQHVLTAMSTDQRNMDEAMQTCLEMTSQALNESEQEDLIYSGESNLLDLADTAGVEKIRSLFDAFTQKRDILHLLDRCLNSDGVQIFVGEESGHELFSECSLVTASYGATDSVVGVLGVIGPTRMDYERVISTVDMTAKLLSATLNVDALTKRG